ncbi:hypothetical protein [Solimicrobium silvestre]|uniref:Bacterial extracellular solute-binding protein, family 3 n=1 Tax=Solimicrobium silvestre TaxID=2099400 RepID=A0A2S9H3Y7_9BURK|nr:hypothetical protein [Solimicrobium silvestre]PRC94643.1 hypothetical protein S2091_0646 [Solimicrobium silvestre]
MLKSGQADVGLHVSYTEERAHYVHWPKNWVWKADFVFMTNQKTKAAYPLHNYDDVRRSGLLIGIVYNNAYYPNFWEAFPSPDRAHQHYDAQLDPATDAATNLRKLEAGHIQLFPTPLVLGTYMIRSMKLANVTYYDWILFTKPYPNAFSDASTYSTTRYPNINALMQAYDLQLARLKSDQIKYQQFIQRY